MTAANSTTTSIPGTTSAEKRAFCRLRDRYHHANDLFTNQEWKHLLFLRWLYRTGRLQP